MLKKLTLEAFSQDVAARRAVPGGGSVSALAGCLAASLTAMVAAFTLEKEAFADRVPQMERLKDQAEQVRKRLLAAVDRDAQSYREVLAAFRLPKTTDKEEKVRATAVQRAFRKATEVPLEVASDSLEALRLAGIAAKRGNPDMVTDAGVGILLARSAALGALMNAEFNLGSLTDKALVAALRTQIEEVKELVVQGEEELTKALVFP